MKEIPFFRAKRTLAVLFLLALAGGTYLAYRQSDPLKGFEPNAIQDERDQKIQALKELLKLEPQDYKTHGELAKLYYTLGGSQEAGKGVEEFKNAEKHALEAVLLGKQQGAKKDFLSELYLLLSKIYQALGNNERALEYAELAAQLDKTKTAPLKRKGQVFEALKKNDKARLEYLRALKLDEKDPETYALLANQEFAKGNKKAAQEWLKMGVRRNPTNATAFRNLARGYARSKEHGKAREAYEQALKLDPNNGALRFEYAKLLKKTGDESAYLAELKKAHAADSKNPKILAAMGDAELAQGNKKNALSHYRDALKGDSRNTELKEKYSRLYNELATAAKGSGTSGDGGKNGSGDGSAGKNGGQGETGSGQDGKGGTAGAGGTDGKNGSSGNAGGDKGNGGTLTDKGDNTLDSGKGGSNTTNAGDAAKFVDAGKKAFADKDYERAELQFRKALEKSPENSDARFFLARSLDAEGKKDAAAAEYKRLLEKEPNHAKANYYLGRLLYQAQKYADAERHFKKSADADGKFAPAHYSLGLAQEKQGKNSEALAAYRKSSEVDSNLTQAHYNSALLFKKNKKYDEALAELSRAGTGGDVEYQRGEVYLKQKKYAEAKEAFTKALAEKSQNYEAAFNLALVYHKLKDPAGADRVLAKVIREDSPADLNYTYGKLLEDSGELTGAEKQYQASVKKDPRYFKGWLNLGRVTASAQKYDQSENAYRQALALEPGSYDANYNLANTLYKQKKYQSAIEYFETAKRQEATREVVMPLAMSYEASGQNEKAAKVYSDYLNENPKDRTSLEKLGYLYYRKIKNRDKALEQFNKLLKYYPESDKAQEYKGMVQLIEKQKGE